MIKHAWTVVCQKTITDKETNNLSLDVMEQIAISFPLLPQDSQGLIFPIQFEVTSLWYSEPMGSKLLGKARLRIEHVSQHIGAADIEIDLTKNHRYRTQIRFNALPIPKDILGYFYFIVELETDKKWQEVSRIPLEIEILKTSGKK